MLVTQGYGMTEATGAVTQDTDKEPKIGSVGRVLPGVIIKVRAVKSKIFVIYKINLLLIKLHQI